MKINSLVVILFLFNSLGARADDLQTILATGTPYDKYNHTEYDVLLFQYSLSNNSKKALIATQVKKIENDYLPKLMGIYQCSDFLYDQIMNDYNDNWDSLYINSNQRFLDSDYFQKGLLINNIKLSTTINRYVCVPHDLLNNHFLHYKSLNNKNKLWRFVMKKLKVQENLSLEKRKLLTIKSFPVERIDLDKGDNNY
ncbi:hypothetical protein [Methylotenera sp. L2L1]|uniref:hypothetical protein n=1 Tax=Methylotenera sp. L2L1 TaxID=1502770 RepID=UPI000559F16F|nr:hypothetical protein [Methylotenera sp. L2L1]